MQVNEASTPDPPGDAVREALGHPADWAAKREELLGWTGSALVAGERASPEDRGNLYLFLCGLIGYLQAGEDAAAAFSTPSDAPEPVANESGGEGNGLRQMPPPGAITDAAYLAGWFEGQQYLIDNATAPNPTTGDAVREALELADAALRGCHMDMTHVERKVRAALAALAKHGGGQ